MLYHLKRGYSAIFNSHGNRFNRIAVPFAMGIAGSAIMATNTTEPSPDVTPDRGAYQAELLTKALGDMQRLKEELDRKTENISKLQWKTNLSTDPALQTDIKKIKQETDPLKKEITIKGFAFERALLLADGISETQSIRFAEDYRVFNPEGFKNYLDVNVTHLPQLFTNLDECQIKNTETDVQGATKIAQCLQNTPYEESDLVALFAGAATGNLFAILLGTLGATWRRQTDEVSRRRKQDVIQQNIRISTKP